VGVSGAGVVAEVLATGGVVAVSATVVGEGVGVEVEVDLAAHLKFSSSPTVCPASSWRGVVRTVWSLRTWCPASRSTTRSVSACR
jgi:hypothetical protein